jgi:hypothetical protein
MSVNQQAGLVRTSLTGLATYVRYLAIKGTAAPVFLLWEELTEVFYVPWVGQGLSFGCGEADAPGSTYFCHLEGSFPAGGMFMEPFSVQYSP